MTTKKNTTPFNTLEERLKKSQERSRSIIPQTSQKEEEDSETDSDYVDAAELPAPKELKARFAQLLAERFEISTIEKELEAQKKGLNTAIQQMLTTFGHTKLRYGQYRALMYETNRSTLDKDMLLRNGVSMGVIEASTKVSRSVATRVTRDKGK